MSDVRAGSASTAEPGRVRGAVVFVSDTDRSLRVYRDVLGLPVGRLHDGQRAAERLADGFGLHGFRGRITPLEGEAAVGRITLVESDAPRLGPRQGLRTDVAQIGQSSLVMSTPRLQEASRELEALGLPRFTDPVDLEYPEWGRFAEFASFDPDGVGMSLLTFRPVPGGPQTDLSAPWRHVDDRRVSPILRVALKVRDTDASLALYRDLLGLKVMATREIEDVHTMGLPGCTVKLTYLGPGGDDGLGVLVLVQISDPEPPLLPPPPSDRPHHGQAAVVLSSDDAARVTSEVRDRGYAPLGSAAFFDADGFLIALEEPGTREDSLFSA